MAPQTQTAKTNPNRGSAESFVAGQLGTISQTHLAEKKPAASPVVQSWPGRHHCLSDLKAKGEKSRGRVQLLMPMAFPPR